MPCEDVYSVWHLRVLLVGICGLMPLLTARLRSTVLFLNCDELKHLVMPLRV
jgi:hypothetical protein